MVLSGTVRVSNTKCPVRAPCLSDEGRIRILGGKRKSPCDIYTDIQLIWNLEREGMNHANILPTP